MIEKIKEIKQKIGDDRVISFVSGNFNILHIGHQRLLRFAKENSDILVVGVNKYDPNTSLIDANLRLEGILNSIFVDYALIIDNYLECIKYLKPDIIVKGKEHENMQNPEYDILKEYGGKLIFSSGNIGFSSFELLQHEFKDIELKKIKKPKNYFLRHNIDIKKIKNTIEDFSKLNIAVIGDTIIDEYIICDPIGMSQEDPTIVITPISNKLFLGGASIVAAHTSSLGASVDYYSVTGKDNIATFAHKELAAYGVNSYLYEDITRPTTLKQRYRANDKTLLRVNHLKAHSIDKAIQNTILKDFEKNQKKYDLVIFSDFSYGNLSLSLINQIIDICKKNNIYISADSQSSSQTGDITKFCNIDLLTPTEREARFGVNDFESGLIVLSD